MGEVSLKERWRNIKNTWHYRRFPDTFEAWKDYRCDSEGKETGIKRTMKGKKSQRLRDCKVIKVERIK